MSSGRVITCDFTDKNPNPGQHLLIIMFEHSMTKAIWSDILEEKFKVKSLVLTGTSQQHRIHDNVQKSTTLSISKITNFKDMLI